MLKDDNGYSLGNGIDVEGLKSALASAALNADRFEIVHRRAFRTCEGKILLPAADAMNIQLSLSSRFVMTSKPSQHQTIFKYDAAPPLGITLAIDTLEGRINFCVSTIVWMQLCGIDANELRGCNG